MMRTLLLALLLCGLPACTVDDSIVEGKHCYAGGTDPDKACMDGYECKCNYGECLCVKIDSLRSLAAEPHAQFPTSSTPWREADPSRSLLRRLGLTPP